MKVDLCISEHDLLCTHLQLLEEVQSDSANAIELRQFTVASRWRHVLQSIFHDDAIIRINMSALEISQDVRSACAFHVTLCRLKNHAQAQVAHGRIVCEDWIESTERIAFTLLTHFPNRLKLTASIDMPAIK